MEFVIKEGKETRITLKGKLDFSSSPKLMNDLDALKGKDIETIVFECAELTYISSAGIRAILFAQQKIAPGMTVVIENAGEEIEEVLDMCGLADVLELRQTQ